MNEPDESTVDTSELPKPSSWKPPRPPSRNQKRDSTISDSGLPPSAPQPPIHGGEFTEKKVEHFWILGERTFFHRWTLGERTFLVLYHDFLNIFEHFSLIFRTFFGHFLIWNEHVCMRRTFFVLKMNSPP